MLDGRQRGGLSHASSKGRVQYARRGSHGQFLASAAATGSENTAAVFGGHAGAETMHLAALTFFRLIGTEHIILSLS